MKKLDLVSPWVDFFREMEAMFAKDKDVKVIFDEDDLVIRLLVEDQDKAEALEKLLVKEKTFGSVTVKVVVVPANKLKSKNDDLFRAAFSGNEAFVDVQTLEGAFSNPITFVVFAKEVIQYYNDDISDFNGLRSTLYQEIAKDIFDVNGVFYSTSKE